jgi:murein L,D-transpeptidase YafK
MNRRSAGRKVAVALCLLLLGAALYAEWPVSAAPRAFADKVVVLKSDHKMMLLRNGELLKTFAVSIARNPVGPKTHNGDHKTPEGNYVIDGRNPQSKFHLSMHVSYPNSRDADNARREAVTPGGNIMIHGLQNGLGWIGRFHRLMDWTDECIAVTNSEMDQVWRAVPDGTPIEIRP